MAKVVHSFKPPLTVFSHWATLVFSVTMILSACVGSSLPQPIANADQNDLASKPRDDESQLSSPQRATTDSSARVDAASPRTPTPMPPRRPTPAPKPAPVAVPAPKPAPVAVPAPKPAPVPVPAPKPAPVAVPAPKPAPVAVPAHKPAPVAVPAPKPAPVSALPKPRAGTVYGNQLTRLVKPPFTATPLGQPLSPSLPQTNATKTVSPPNSKPVGGSPGYTRTEPNGFAKHHQGLDLGKALPQPLGWRESVPTTYTGQGEGRVVGVRKDPRWGVIVAIEFKKDGVVWKSTTMHHREATVKFGELVAPGQVIAIGAGYGDQFKLPDAGPPHIHWNLQKNGEYVHPLNGATLVRRSNAQKKPKNPQ